MIRIFCFILIAILALGCKKKITKPVNAETKSAFTFKPGTYWIYRDSVTGKEDSLYVEKNGSSNSSGTESIATFINTSGRPDVTAVSFHLHENVVSYKFLLYINGGIGELNGSINYPYEPSIPTIKLLPTLSVNGNTFDNVIHQYGGGNNFYLRANIGIIKANIIRDTFRAVWDLQRYKIVQ